MPFLSEFKLKLGYTVHVHLYFPAFFLLVLIAYLYLTLNCKFCLFFKILLTRMLQLEINQYYYNNYDYFLQSIEEVGIKKLEWNFEKVR